MRNFVLCFAAVLSTCFLADVGFADCSGSIAASCSGVKRATPVRNLIAAKPVRSTLQVFRNGLSNRLGCQSEAANCAASSSCSGPVSSSCSGGSVSSSPAPQPVPVATSEVRHTHYVSTGLAQQKSETQASTGRIRHVGGSMGAGSYEGVGFSSVSADDAIRRSCYYGQRTPVDVGVVKGPGGWYATVLYR